jgi:hypothetical protein
MTAVVNADGTLMRGTGVVSVTPVGASYDLVMERRLDNCTFSAMAANVTAFGGMTANYGTAYWLGDNRVQVAMRNPANQDLRAGAFHLQVICWK